MALKSRAALEELIVRKLALEPGKMPLIDMERARSFLMRTSSSSSGECRIPMRYG